MTPQTSYQEIMVPYRYVSFVLPTGQVWHMTFFRGVRVQGSNPDTPSDSKTASGPVSIAHKRGASGTRWLT